MTARVRERHREAAHKWVTDPRGNEEGTAEAIASLAALLAETEAAALERAAKVADEFASGHPHRNLDGGGINAIARGAPEAAFTIALAIRALIEADE